MKKEMDTIILDQDLLNNMSDDDIIHETGSIR